MGRVFVNIMVELRLAFMSHDWIHVSRVTDLRPDRFTHPFEGLRKSGFQREEGMQC